MTAMPTLLIVWGGLVTAFLSLLAYRGKLTRYEDDQLFLSGNNEIEQMQQEEIVRKVQLIAPAVRMLGGAAGLMTVAIIGMIVWNAVLQLQ